MSGDVDGGCRNYECYLPKPNDLFLKHLKEASKIVSTWPKWKQNVLKQREKTSRQNYRKELENQKN